MGYEIKVYSKPACVQGNATCKALDGYNLAYSVIDISEEPGALDYVMSLGYRQAPVVVVQEDACRLPIFEGVVRDVGITPKSQSITTPESWSGFRPDRIRYFGELYGPIEQSQKSA